MDTELVVKAREFAENVFKDSVFEKSCFHNLNHTRDVVKAAEEIGRHTELNPDEMESVVIAAWLHDIGYKEGREDHEQKSADKAKELLEQWGASPKKILDVTEAILATLMPQQPKSMVSKVLCDADLYHLSTKGCDAQSGKLREEWKRTGIKSLTDKEWVVSSLEFMEGHQYQTPYGQTI